MRVDNPVFFFTFSQIEGEGEREEREEREARDSSDASITASSDLYKRIRINNG